MKDKKTCENIKNFKRIKIIESKLREVFIDFKLLMYLVINWYFKFNTVVDIFPHEESCMPTIYPIDGETYIF